LPVAGNNQLASTTEGLRKPVEHFHVCANFRMANTVRVLVRLRIRGRRSKFLFLIYAFAPCRIRYDAVGVFVHAALSSTVDLSVFGYIVHVSNDPSNLHGPQGLRPLWSATCFSSCGGTERLRRAATAARLGRVRLFGQEQFFERRKID
jgi:hypothetical protein